MVTAANYYTPGSKMAKKYLTVPQVASQLGVSRQLVHRWIGQDRIPAIRFGREYLLPAATARHPRPKKIGRPRSMSA